MVVVPAAQLKVRFFLETNTSMTLGATSHYLFQCFLSVAHVAPSVLVNLVCVQWRGIRITTWWQRAKGGVLILGPW